jgi:hypothetical protein
MSRFGSQECVEVHGWVPHRDVIRAFYESTVQVLIQHGEAGVELTIPGKAYELMATGRHVLGIQVRQRELAGMLRAYGNSTLVGQYEPAAIAEALAALYHRWRRGALPPRVPPQVVGRFSRVETTRQLASLANRAVGATALPGLRRRTADAFRPASRPADPEPAPRPALQPA